MRLCPSDFFGGSMDDGADADNCQNVTVRYEINTDLAAA